MRVSRKWSEETPIFSKLQYVWLISQFFSAVLHNSSSNGYLFLQKSLINHWYKEVIHFSINLFIVNNNKTPAFFLRLSNKQLLLNCYIVLNIPNIYEQQHEGIIIHRKLLAIFQWTNQIFIIWKTSQSHYLVVRLL